MKIAQVALRRDFAYSSFAFFKAKSSSSAATGFLSEESSSPAKSSESEILRIEQRATIREASGRDLPRSHLLTARSETQSLFANPAWVNEACFLLVAMKEPIFSLSIIPLRENGRTAKRKRIQTYG